MRDAAASATTAHRERASAVPGLPGWAAAAPPFDARVGAWAEYVVQSSRGTARMRLSVLEASDAALAIEAAMFGGTVMPFAARLRFRSDRPAKCAAAAWLRGRMHDGARSSEPALDPASRDERTDARGGVPANAAPSTLPCVATVESMTVYLLGLAPLDVPLADTVTAASAPTAFRRIRTMHVSVPAGRFETEELGRGADERVWVTPAVPLWGVVRARDREFRVDLVAFGLSGAHSFIPGQGIGRESTNE
jgi:hypothetical protein